MTEGQYTIKLSFRERDFLSEGLSGCVLNLCRSQYYEESEIKFGKGNSPANQHAHSCLHLLNSGRTMLDKDAAIPSVSRNLEIIS